MIIRMNLTCEGYYLQDGMPVLEWRGKTASGASVKVYTVAVVFDKDSVAAVAELCGAIKTAVTFSPAPGWLEDMIRSVKIESPVVRSPVGNRLPPAGGNGEGAE